MNKIPEHISGRNFTAFVWHATFLAIAKNFMDVDTIIPAMLLEAGGSNFHLGLLTAIMVGGSRFSQIFFIAPISAARKKKPMLLGAVNMRILSLAGIALLFLYSPQLEQNILIVLIFLIITLFSFSGAFANIPYTDILGKSVLPERRKQFFSLRTIISSAGIFGSAFLVREILGNHAYPGNYSRVFFYAAGFLFMASLGFWAIKEFIPGNYKTLKTGISDIVPAIRSNPRLKWYLISINTLGLAYGMLPFILLFARENQAISGEHGIGDLLIAKTTGLIVSGVFLYFRKNKARYQNMMYFMIAVAVSFVTIVWIFPHVFAAYLFSFFLGGIYLGLFQIVINGVLLEISHTGNRPLFTGISGAGSILPVLFPLFGGSLIALTGFHIFFSLFSAISLLSYVFIRKLNCKK